MQKSVKPKLLFLKPQKIICSLNLLCRENEDLKIKSLADNISVNGIIEPLIVRQNNAGKYELIIGLRRLKAAKLLGLRRVPCIITNADDETAAFLSLSENMQRNHIRFTDEAKAIKQVMNRYDTSYTLAAEKLGISNSSLINKLNLLNLDSEVFKAIEKSGISERHARIVLFVDKEKQYEFLNEIIKNDLSIAQTRSLAEKYISGTEFTEKASEGEKSSPPIRKTAISDQRFFANSLSKLISLTKSSGVEAYSRKSETENYTEYRIRIMKPISENYNQLKLV